MNYIILNNDASLKYQYLSEFIQQGSNNVNHLLFCKNDITTGTDYTCYAYFIQPNGSTSTVAGVWDNTGVVVDGITYYGFKITLSDIQTKYNGLLCGTLVINHNQTRVLSYPVGLVINKTGYQNEGDSGVPVEALNSYLVQLQSYQEKYNLNNARFYPTIPTSAELGLMAEGQLFGHLVNNLLMFAKKTNTAPYYQDLIITGLDPANYYTKTESDNRFENLSNKNVANGYAGLDANTKILLSQLPDVILSQLLYGGNIDAYKVATITADLKTRLNIEDNTIEIVNSDTDDLTTTPKKYGYVTLKNVYFIASENGTIGSIEYNIGDWIISIGSAWSKIDNTDAVTGVKGGLEATYRIGNVNIQKDDILTNAEINVLSSGITNNKVNAYDYHIADSNIHTSLNEKANWNAKSVVSVSSSGTSSDTISYITVDGVEKKLFNGEGTYLPLTGGTMTGSIISNVNGAIIQSNNSNSIYSIIGGTNWDNGSAIRMSGVNSLVGGNIWISASNRNGDGAILELNGNGSFSIMKQPYGESSVSYNIIDSSLIIDNLTTQTTNVPLSANQGYVLKGLIDAKSVVNANPTLSGTESDLTSIKIDGTSYKIYNALTGVKGSQEATYRIGDVNITASNILTSEEISAIDSGITSSKVAIYDNYATNKQNALTNLQLDAVNSGITSAKVTNYDNYATSKINVSDIINNVTSTDIDKPLSANQGKVLNDRINNISSVGRFLTTFNASNGTIDTYPPVRPYEFKDGDYFIVSVVGTYKPKDNVTQIPAIGDIEVETSSTSAKVNDIYRYDEANTSWILQQTTVVQTTFSSIAGQPTDNTNLASALNLKQDVSNLVTTITSSSTDSQYPSAKLVYDSLLTKQSNLSSTQLNAVNSGVTSSKITSYDNHISNTSNPHSVTKTQIGLDNVTNDLQLKASDKVINVLSTSTDDEIPSAKAVYTIVDSKQDTLSSAQLNAVNSGVTTSKISNYDTHIANTSIHTNYTEKSTWNAKQNALTTSQLNACNSGATSSKITSYDNHIADTTIHTTASEKSTWNAKQNALSNTQLNAVNSGITSSKVTTYDDYATTKVSVSDIIDNLTTQSNDLPLSANQGYVLKGLVDGKSTVSASATGTSSTDISYITIGSTEYHIAGSGTANVTGVKGSQESSYRTGNVNITTANILTTAQQSAIDSGIDSSKVSTYNGYATTIGAKQDTANIVTSFQTTPDDTHYPSEKLLKTQIDNVVAVAEGKTKTYVISAKSDITGTESSAGDFTNVTAITGITIANLKVGDIILVTALETPDYWVSQISPSVSLNKLETTKVDLSGYQKTSELVTSISSTSTDSSYPTAKAVYTIVNTKQNTLTAAQQNAVDSGIDSTKVGTYDGYSTTKQDALSSSQLDACDSGITNGKVGSYDTHIASTSNPHGVTKSQVGLGNVNNEACLPLDGSKSLTGDLTINNSTVSRNGVLSIDDSGYFGLHNYDSTFGDDKSFVVDINGLISGTAVTKTFGQYPVISTSVGGIFFYKLGHIIYWNAIFMRSYSNTIIGTLPRAYRPFQESPLDIYDNYGQTSVAKRIQCWVNTDGTVSIGSYGSTEGAMRGCGCYLCETAYYN